MLPSLDWLTALVNLVMVITLAEIVWLMRPRTRPGLAKKPLLANLLAGFGLLMALRLAVGGAGWPWVALALAASGVAHVIDLRARWRAGPQADPALFILSPSPKDSP